MTDIIIKGKKDDILVKCCPDFVAMEDGTISGEKKYCQLSFECKQIGMKSDFVEMFDPKTGEMILCDYLCSGKKPIFEERMIDEEAS